MNGGAIVFDSYSPQIENLVFYNNSASFGNDTASYAVSLKQVINDSLVDLVHISDVPSGEAYGESINLAIVDAEEDDIMTSDSTSTMHIKALDQGSSIGGQSTIAVTNGKGSFTDCVFTASPGRTGVRYELTSTAIDYGKLSHLNSSAYSEQIFTIDFRWCMPGEIQIGDICSPCTDGTYSVTWNATICENCPNHASCVGKQISLSKGYWRFDANSTEIIECPNEEACLGGFNETNEYPVNWAEGYTGILWNECIIKGKKKYERINENTCSECPDPLLNMIRIIGIGLSIIIFLTILVA